MFLWTHPLQQIFGGILSEEVVGCSLCEEDGAEVYGKHCLRRMNNDLRINAAASNLTPIQTARNFPKGIYALCT
ncbi:MAG: hypothetical protein DMG96_42075 [Acidobacteria bacterium]|nr:MAG: hypothetical protein DMG96_42075 [Acidobacteriota bacterium]